jgi:hypothetical protein
MKLQLGENDEIPQFEICAISLLVPRTILLFQFFRSPLALAALLKLQWTAKSGCLTTA